MIELKQSTAITLPFGPFLDSTDGVTEETGLSSQTGIIYKAGTSSAFTPASWSHDSNGMYLIGFSASHTDTLGPVRIYFHDSTTYLPVWRDFEVIPANVYDARYGSDYLQVDVVQVAGASYTENMWKQHKRALGMGDVSGWNSTNHEGDLQLALGILGHNSVRDDFSYDSLTGKKLESFKIYIYDTYAHAAAHVIGSGEQTGCVAVYTVALTHTTVNLESYKGGRTT